MTSSRSGEPRTGGWSLWNIILVTIAVLLGGTSAWFSLTGIFTPDRLQTNLAIITGVLHHTPATYGHAFWVVTDSGDRIPLHCQPFPRSGAGYCLDEVARSGAANFATRRDDNQVGPPAKVTYVRSDNARFGNIVIAVEIAGRQYLDTDARLRATGLDPTGRFYSETRERQAKYGSIAR